MGKRGGPGILYAHIEDKSDRVDGYLTGEACPWCGNEIVTDGQTEWCVYSMADPMRKHCPECGGFRFAGDKCQVLWCETRGK